ncbi:MAG: protein-disulfide reductase DsbD domain-containing protein [Planctomycetota bacterium]
MTHNSTIHLAAIAASLWVSHAHAEQSWLAKQHPAEVTMIAEHDAFLPGGTTLVGFRFVMQDGWHIYWDGLNDTGFAPQWELELPEGWEVGETLWPAPHRYISPGGILDHVYEEEVVLMVPVRVPPDASGDATIRAELEWLVCKEACIAGSGSASITLPVGNDPRPSDEHNFFETAESRLPIELPERAHQIELQGDRLVVSAPNAIAIAFYPERDSAEPRDVLRGCIAQGDALSVELKPGDEPCRGIIEITNKDETATIIAIDVTR